MTSPPSDHKIDPLIDPAEVMANVPTKAVDSHWYYAQKADARANALQRDVNELHDELRQLDVKHASLTERLHSLKRHHGLTNSISACFNVLAGILAGIALYLASSDPTKPVLTWGAAALAGVFLVLAIGVCWLPFSKRFN